MHLVRLLSLAKPHSQEWLIVALGCGRFEVSFDFFQGFALGFR
jgi:hypothetical protein